MHDYNDLISNINFQINNILKDNNSTCCFVEITLSIISVGKYSIGITISSSYSFSLEYSEYFSKVCFEYSPKNVVNADDVILAMDKLIVDINNFDDNLFILGDNYSRNMNKYHTKYYFYAFNIDAIKQVISYKHDGIYTLSIHLKNDGGYTLNYPENSLEDVINFSEKLKSINRYDLAIQLLL